MKKNIKMNISFMEANELPMLTCSTIPPYEQIKFVEIHSYLSRSIY